jgi:hypothetical protein
MYIHIYNKIIPQNLLVDVGACAGLGVYQRDEKNTALCSPSTEQTRGKTEHAWPMLNLPNITNEYFLISVERVRLPSILARFIAECACLTA